jgi:hypothetical protein
LLRQPWHIGDAFYWPFGLRSADARGAVSVRRRGHRTCRRLRPVSLTNRPPPCCTWGQAWRTGRRNLHNARRPHSPVINVVGDHATHHQKLDAPLQSDIDALGHRLSDAITTEVPRARPLTTREREIVRLLSGAVGIGANTPRHEWENHRGR